VLPSLSAIAQQHQRAQRRDARDVGRVRRQEQRQRLARLGAPARPSNRLAVHRALQVRVQVGLGLFDRQQRVVAPVLCASAAAVPSAFNVRKATLAEPRLASLMVRKSPVDQQA
jgi:hypothetical protein